MANIDASESLTDLTVSRTAQTYLRGAASGEAALEHDVFEKFGASPDQAGAAETLAGFLSAALRDGVRPQAFGERRAGGAQFAYTPAQRMHERACEIAGALRAAGLVPGDRVALIANNRVDWIAADFGILFAGCVVVPIFATLAADHIKYILVDSGAKLCFVETSADADRLRAAYPDTPRTIYFDGSGTDALAEFERSGAGAVPSAVMPAEAALSAAPDSLAVLVYTSGTTGEPKGVMLSHRNLVFNARAAAELLPPTVRSGDAPVLSVLPFAHIYEHTLLNTYVAIHARLHVTQPAVFADDLKAVRPRVMALVPRIFERVLAGIAARAKSEGGYKAKVIPWALETGRAYMAAMHGERKPGAALRLRYAVAHQLVLRKIRPALGLDRLEFFSSGSAPLHRDIALTFAGMGIPVAEGYGLTETAPIVTATSFDAIRYGSVGKVIPGVRLRIAADGEILVKGPSVMLGYYHLPLERPFTDDGWFATGDIGVLDRDGYLFITDRKKELIKTTAGKYVAPSRVGAALERSIYVGQCLVVGDGRPYPVALVAPQWDLIRKEFGIPSDVATETIAARNDVLEFMQREVAESSADLASFEAVRRIALLPCDLTLENGELSPTFKIKRRVVETKFAALIASAYAPSGSASSAPVER